MNTSSKLRPLAAVAVVALIGAGCSSEPTESDSAGNTSARQEKRDTLATPAALAGPLPGSGSGSGNSDRPPIAWALTL